MEIARRELPQQSSMPRCCPSCGQQVEVYRGRLLSLVHDNKALALENRQLKAEVRIYHALLRTVHGEDL